MEKKESVTSSTAKRKGFQQGSPGLSGWDGSRSWGGGARGGLLKEKLKSDVSSRQERSKKSGGGRRGAGIGRGRE